MEERAPQPGMVAVQDRRANPRQTLKPRPSLATPVMGQVAFLPPVTDRGTALQTDRAADVTDDAIPPQGEEQGLGPVIRA
jgi:hypothetical protein